jgi:hypothetical protein
VEAGVVRADGRAPGEIEATALAVLALLGDRESSKLTPDLGASLLSAYSPSLGWGDGQTNLAALLAVLALFKDPLPPKVAVKLALDDRLVVEGVLEGAKLNEVLALDAALPKRSGPHRLRVTADPPVPGLAFSIGWKFFVPWPAAPRGHGLELAIETPKETHAGQPADIALAAQAPAGIPLTLRHALPAGVQPDRASLDALVSSGAITSYTTEDGAVTMSIAAREVGQGFQARYRVIPTLSGKLTSGASSLAVADPSRAVEPFFLPPSKWVVK